MAHNPQFGLGGWSFSTSLEADDGNRTFTANGPSVGAGWERQIADSWSFRAEYRYTKFLDRTLSTPNVFTATSVVVPGGGTTVSSSQSASSTTISSDLHAFRLGLARAITPQ